MGLQEIALAGLGLVLVGSYSTKTGAGEGLSTLGAGVTSLIAAPGAGFGLGLQETAKGIFDIGEAIGGIGRGFGEWFEFFPKLPDFEYRGPGGSSDNLVPDSGGSGSDNLPGGGGNVPPGLDPPEGPRISGPPMIFAVNVSGGGYSFEGARTIWKTEEAAMKNYARANMMGANNV